MRSIEKKKSKKVFFSGQIILDTIELLEDLFKQYSIDFTKEASSAQDN